MKHIETFIFSMFFAIGMVFVIIGLALFVPAYSRQQEYIPAKAEIIQIYYEGKDDHTVIVQYTVNDTVYKSKLNFYSSSFSVGQEIDILYSPENPKKISAKDSAALFLIFPGVGAIFALIGFSGIFVKLRKKILRKRLLENGEKIYADFVEVTKNWHYSVNHRHPYNVICRWQNPTDGQTYTFKSENLWDYPQYLTENTEIQIPVYTDIFNIKKYYMDLSELSGENQSV